MDADVSQCAGLGGVKTGEAALHDNLPGFHRLQGDGSLIYSITMRSAYAPSASAKALQPKRSLSGLVRCLMFLPAARNSLTMSACPSIVLVEISGVRSGSA